MKDNSKNVTISIDIYGAIRENASNFMVDKKRKPRSLYSTEEIPGNKVKSWNARQLRFKVLEKFKTSAIYAFKLHLWLYLIAATADRCLDLRKSAPIDTRCDLTASSFSKFSSTRDAPVRDRRSKPSVISGVHRAHSLSLTILSQFYFPFKEQSKSELGFIVKVLQSCSYSVFVFTVSRL